MLDPIPPTLACGPDPVGMAVVLFLLPALGALGVWMVFKAVRSETHRWCLGPLGGLLAAGGVYSLGIWWLILAH